MDVVHEITHRVYLEVDIDKQRVGMKASCLFSCGNCCQSRCFVSLVVWIMNFGFGSCFSNLANL